MGYGGLTWRQKVEIVAIALYRAEAHPRLIPWVKASEVQAAEFRQRAETALNKRGREDDAIIAGELAAVMDY